MEREEKISKDATSKETLADIEESEVLSQGESEDEELPSPDGALDESKEQQEADPM